MIIKWKNSFFSVRNMYSISLAKLKKQLLRETKKEIMLKEAKIFLKVLIYFYSNN